MNKSNLPWETLGLIYDEEYELYDINDPQNYGYVLSAFKAKDGGWQLELETPYQIFSIKEIKQFKCQTDVEAFGVAAYLLGVNLPKVNNKKILNKYNTLLEKF